LLPQLRHTEKNIGSLGWNLNLALLSSGPLERPCVTLNPETPTMQKHTLKLEDGTLDYFLERKARKTALGLVVSAPTLLPQSRLEEALLGKQGWIGRKLAQFTAPAKQAYQLVYLGRTLEQKFVPGLVQARLVGDTLELPDGDPMALERWYRTQAAAYLPGRVMEWAGERFKPARVSITGARGRWGSCSSGKRLNFSWRTMRLAPDLIDYVIVHELCHLEHLDHSSRFWAALEGIMPDFRVRHGAIQAVSMI
jgi:predicted metal-dependent hydrolase